MVTELVCVLAGEEHHPTGTPEQALAYLHP